MTPTSSLAAIRVRARQPPPALLDCVDHLRMRFGEAVDDAEDLLDDDGQVIAAR